MRHAVTMLLTMVHFVRARWRWRFLRGKRLRSFQEKRARRIVAYAYRCSPFYRLHWEGRDPRRWRTLPTVDKGLMMEHFSTFNTQGIGREEATEVALKAEQSRDFTPTLRGITVGLSSGTSGHRGLFLAGPWEQAAWAGNILSRTIHELRPRRLRVAFFLRSNSNLYEKVGGLLVQFRFFDLMMPLERAVSQLNSFRPHIVVGPPSLLSSLAGEQGRGTLSIQPERLVSVAEVLEPQDAEHLRAVFGAPVHQIYQCTEGLLAASCKEGSLHIQEDLAVLQMEPLPGGGGRVSPVVTDLWRSTQPIIRYRLNDVLKLSKEPCQCSSHFRVIEAIEGRCDDVLQFKMLGGGDRVRPFFPDTIRRMVLLASPDIEDYFAVQMRDGELRIHIQVLPQADFNTVTEKLRQSVQATVAHYGCEAAALTVEQGLPHLASGSKRRRVVRTQRDTGYA